MWARQLRLIGLTLGALAVGAVLVAVALAGSRPPGRSGSSPVVPREATSVVEVAAGGVGVRTPAARPLRSSVRTASSRPVRRLAATVSIDLCSKAGSQTIVGATSVSIWGFALKPTGVPCSDSSVVPQLPGPVLDVSVGDVVTVTIHNELAEPVALALPGLALQPDQVGAPAGGTKSYTFTAARPGTFVYEAGTNAARQVAMGLYGALIVRSATPAQAYGTGASAYDSEAVLVLSEIDPSLNANPAGFNLLDYAPRYWLINGKAYSPTGVSTDTIPAAPGQKVLLRYVNAGLSNYTMQLVGAHQRVIAKDAYPTRFPFDAVSETFASGQTGDTVVTVPAAASGTKFPLYNRQLHVTNGASFPGGMLTFLAVP